MQDLISQAIAYLHAMWRYRWTGLLIAWIVAVTGWLFVYAMPDHYRAKAVVYVDTESVMTPLLEGLVVDTDNTSELEAMTHILLSRENLQEVLRQTDLDLELTSPVQRDAMIRDLMNNISIISPDSGRSRRSTDNRIFEISYSSSSPRQTYQVVNHLLSAFIEKTLYSSRTDTEMAQRFLDKQIAEYEQRLTIAEQRLANFKKENVGLMPDEKGGYYTRLQGGLSEIERIESELRLARQRVAELRRQLSGETPVLNRGLYGDEAQLRQYEQQLSELLMQYTDSHPDVIALRSRIAELTASRSTRQEPTTYTGNGQDVEFNPVYQDLKFELSKAGLEVETLRTQLGEARQRVDRLRESVDAIPEVEAQLAKLNRDYNVTKERYLNLVERRETARLLQEVEQNSSEITVQVIEPPRVPARPYGPDRPLLLTGVLAMACLAGLGWGVFRYLLSPTFLSSRQIKDTLEIPVLGVVSLYVEPRHRMLRRAQLASFLIGVAVLIGVYGGVVLKQEHGSAYVRAMVADAGVNL